ncbi:hypothetical protein [Mesorhizobium sp. Z1-4]|uniref:hypothetical protein n=1 Tax=Mesorhizobium sp. Z1-4 TaxID=2448478 RepID=UPI000FDA5D5F|nr:hypothetical protein [Mesorhizobium sp. Z1-4]
MPKRYGWTALAAAAALSAYALPALAWDQLDLGTNSAGQPTYAPEGQGNGQLKFKDLPGVHLNPGGQTASGDCSESKFYSDKPGDFGSAGSVTECNFGKFSLRTYRSSGTPSSTGYNPFPVPAPLQQPGPPPGSGGYSSKSQTW